MTESLAPFAPYVIIVVLLVDKCLSSVSRVSQREEFISMFREGGRIYAEGYRKGLRQGFRDSTNLEAEKDARDKNDQHGIDH